MKKILILGASGSIGRQALEVIEKYHNDFSLISFSVGDRTRIISHILRKHKEVHHICIKEKSKIKYYQNKYPHIHFYYGDEGLINIIKDSHPDMVVNALVGFVGLRPSIVTLENNLTLSLANKESLVVGGEIINNLLKQGKGKLFPIDSEHVALAKCLGVEDKNVDKLIITASGGSFRNLTRDELKNVTKKDALAHPTWKMGNKITIDSATMVNKAFEIIEAHYLFNYPYNKIDIVLHYESMIHSMVKYKDNSYRVDYSKPDMRVPIKYALFEGLIDYVTYKVNDYHSYKNLTFKQFDYDRFPIVKWAKKVIEEKGTYGAVFNAANEVAVFSFLKEEIPFVMIEEVINVFMKKHKNIIHPSLDDIIKTDLSTREEVKKYIARR